MDLDINIAEEIIKLWKSRIYTNIMTEVALGRGGKNDREEGKKNNIRSVMAFILF